MQWRSLGRLILELVKAWAAILAGATVSLVLAVMATLQATDLSVAGFWLASYASLILAAAFMLRKQHAEIVRLRSGKITGATDLHIALNGFINDGNDIRNRIVSEFRMERTTEFSAMILSWSDKVVAFLETNVPTLVVLYTSEAGFQQNSIGGNPAKTKLVNYIDRRLARLFEILKLPQPT